MVFSSIEYAIFLPLVLVGYYLLTHRGQNRFLLLASYTFYAAWNWKFLGLMFLSTVVDFSAAKRIEDGPPHQRKLWLSLSVFVNLGALGFFKYCNFFVDNFRSLLSTAGLNIDTGTLDIILPVGISFYTLQTLGYTIDVYRGQMKACRKFEDFALYVSFFPQLVAGPIERASNLIPQVQRHRSVRYKHLRLGGFLILLGLFQKIAIADNLAPIVERTFSDPRAHNFAELMIGIYAFAFQIYGDFAGYSNIAVGTAALLGFTLMENFKTPYFSKRVGEFWKRWHISLSSWLHDYLYVPLLKQKGSRKKSLIITMLISGVWHGAAWTMICWGGVHGLWLLFREWTRDTGISPKRKGWGSTFVLFHAVCFIWVFFRADTLEMAAIYLSNVAKKIWVLQFGLGRYEISAIVLIGVMLLLDGFQYRTNTTYFCSRWKLFPRSLSYALLLTGIFLLGGGHSEPFIYFQF